MQLEDIFGLVSLENRCLQDKFMKFISDIFRNYDKKYNLRSIDFPIQRFSV